MNKKSEIQNKPEVSMFEHGCFYISTTLPYINSKPHIGHAFEFVIADFLNRYYNAKHTTIPTKKLKKNLEENFKKEYVSFFNTGVDEHGQKVFQKAIEEGLKPQEYCNNMAKKWENFCNYFGIRFNNFYRTSSKKHKELSQDYLYKIKKYIFQKQYNGKYCMGCESFKTEKEIKNNKCDLHNNVELQDISETNFFFDLSKFKKIAIDDILVNKNLFSELKSIIANFDEISISRENVEWGIPIPFSNQTMYVWFEALLNYIFAIGYNPALSGFLDFSEMWKNSLIVCGKDNLKFQAFILPAILKADEIKPPYKVLVHGMILDKEGVKMSKSLGNVIDPIEQSEKYGINALRYYFLSGLNTFQDSNFSEQDLINKYNNDLANNLGNLISRVFSLDEKINRDASMHCLLNDFDSIVFISPFLIEVKKEIERAQHELEINFNIKNSFVILNNLISKANKYYTEQKPFDKKSTNTKEILIELIYLFELIAPFYESVCPGYTNSIDGLLKNNTNKNKILFPKISEDDKSIVKNPKTENVA